MTACAAVTPDGPCGAPAQIGSPYCWWHDPAREYERAEASARGGRAPRKTGVDLADVRPTLDSPEKMAAIVESYMGGLAKGKATVPQLRAVTGAASFLLQAWEAGAVRREIDELKTKVKALEEARDARR